MRLLPQTNNKIFNRRWGYSYGPWWMVQYAIDYTFSLGIHIDPVKRAAYGPYIDIHFIFMALSLGRNPAAANNHSLMRPILMEGKS